MGPWGKTTAGDLVTAPSLFGGEGFRVEAGFPFEAGDVAVEIAGCDVEQAAGGFEFALVLVDEKLAVRTEADAVGLAEAGGDGGEFAVGVKSSRPSRGA